MTRGVATISFWIMLRPDPWCSIDWQRFWAALIAGSPREAGLAMFGHRAGSLCQLRVENGQLFRTPPTARSGGCEPRPFLSLFCPYRFSADQSLSLKLADQLVLVDLAAEGPGHGLDHEDPIDSSNCGECGSGPHRSQGWVGTQLCGVWRRCPPSPQWCVVGWKSLSMHRRVRPGSSTPARDPTANFSSRH